MKSFFLELIRGFDVHSWPLWQQRSWYWALGVVCGVMLAAYAWSRF